MDSFSGKRTEGTQGVGPGTRLGVFELREPLGRGGMGQVWLAYDTQGKRNVAVKILPPELKGNADAIDQVTAAFQVVHALTHQHIGKTIGLFDDAEHGPYIVMDLVRGVPLSKYAREYRAARKTIAVERVVELLRPVAEALDYAHRKSVLHRDIKPQNILIQHRPDFSVEDVVLIDFGLAAEIRSTMARHTKGKVDASGTRPYMSPEQLRGKPGQWDARTDQYSLAVVAYELLAGHLPFESEDDMALMMAVLNEPVDPIPGVTPAVNAALLRGLAKNKEDRAAGCVPLIDSLAGKAAPRTTEPASGSGFKAGKTAVPPKPKAKVPDDAPSPGTASSAEAQRLRLVLLGNMLDGRTRQAYLAARTETEVLQDEQEGRIDGAARMNAAMLLSAGAIGFFFSFVGATYETKYLIFSQVKTLNSPLGFVTGLISAGILLPIARAGNSRRAALWKKYGPMPFKLTRKGDTEIAAALFKNSR